jgi:prepilin-type N-terminal cleavage/methylation domain-containing protein
MGLIFYLKSTFFYPTMEEMFRQFQRQRAFSMIELLFVMAIVAILYAIAVPIGNNIKNSSLTLKAKAQFSQYILALDAYKQEYGKYPSFIKPDQSVNLKEVAEDFVKSLSGRALDGQPLPEEEAKLLNHKGICFYNFPELASQEPILRDPFGNSDIYVVAKAENAISIPKSNDAFKKEILDQIPPNGLRTHLAVYTLAKGRCPSVQTW